MGVWDEAGDEAPKTEDYTDLLVVYRAMVDAMRQGQKLIDAGQKEKFDVVRYNKLETKVNNLWPKLSREDQRSACNELVKSGHMPQTYADILLMSNGTINMEKPPEPCIRLP